MPGSEGVMGKSALKTRRLIKFVPEIQSIDNKIHGDARFPINAVCFPSSNASLNRQKQINERDALPRPPRVFAREPPYTCRPPLL